MACMLSNIEAATLTNLSESIVIIMRQYLHEIETHIRRPET